VADRPSGRPTTGRAAVASPPSSTLGAAVGPLRRPNLTTTLGLAGVLLLSACTGDDDPEAPGGGEGGTATAEDQPDPEPCVAPAEQLTGQREPLAGGEVPTAAFDCADAAVTADDDPALLAIAAPLAVDLDGPLLAGAEADLTATLEALDDPEVRRLDAGEDVTATAVEVADELGTDRFVAVASDEPADLAGAAAVAVRDDLAVLPVDPAGPAPDLPAGAEVRTLGELDEVFPDADPVDAPWDVAGDAELAWVIDPADSDAAPTIVAAALRGDTVVPVSDGDLHARRAISRVRDADLTADQLVPVGDLASEDLDRDLHLLADGELLPGGTLRHFDGTRMVALYGLPGTPVLGALGEQDLDASVERAREVSEGYGADGRDVIPTFEVIVTVASREAGDDGQYSRVAPPEQFRELVDRAREEDFQVVLDLQPGRNDFLDQAQIYEELLREPHVGLALDPEWRLEPDQVHLEQIGRVEAEEVQRVVDWFAELTREEGLPQQLLVLHQFRLSMLQDRDTIEVPDEIAAVVHADGQGPQGMKLETWQVLTQGAEDRWHWGWKNFYDEDPVVAEPSYVLDLEPEVVFVTYQ
jgi:hypothetical protein